MSTVPGEWFQYKYTLIDQWGVHLKSDGYIVAMKFRWFATVKALYQF